jgi:EmrB/QacA subfamily drug resistance transporter
MPKQPHENEDPSGGPQRRGLILAAIMMATFMTAVESTIVATAMPTIVADLGDFRLFSWVFTASLLAQVVTVPIYGRLADLYGRKRVFYFGAGLFLIGSALCGFAPGMLWLIVFRTLQGLGAGAVQPVAYIIAGDIYTPAQRARVQGLLSGCFGVAAIVGPSAGAFLVEHADWAIIFWINLPIGAVAIAMLAAFLREQPLKRSHQIDYLGSLLLMFGAGILTVALVQAESLGMSLFVLCVLAGVAALAALWWHERRAAEPMLPLELWRSRVVMLGNLGSFAIGAVMMGVSAFLPTYVQGVMNRSAAAAGIALSAMSVSWSIASVVAGQVMIKTSYRVSAVFGALALTLGSAVLVAMTPVSALAWAAVGALLIGVGMGFCNTTFLVAVQASVNWQSRGAATSSNMFMRTAGQSTGAALFGAMVNFGIQHHAPQAGNIVDRLMDPTMRQHLGAAAITQLTAALAAALQNVYLVSGLLGLVALALAAALPARLSPIRAALDSARAVKVGKAE